MDRINVTINGSANNSSTSIYKSLILKGNYDFSSLIVSPFYKYIIKNNFDLNNATITIPRNCLIEIDGGSISNGTLVGQDTILIYYQSKEDIFKNVTLDGSWKENGSNSDIEEAVEDIKVTLYGDNSGEGGGSAGETISVEIKSIDTPYKNNSCDIQAGDKIVNDASYAGDVIFIWFENGQSLLDATTPQVRLGGSSVASAPIKDYVFNRSYNTVRISTQESITLTIQRGGNSSGSGGLVEEVDMMKTTLYGDGGEGSGGNIEIPLEEFEPYHTNFNGLTIPKGSTIKSMDGYPSDGVVIFCPNESFVDDASINLRLGGGGSTVAPLVGYTFEQNYQSLRLSKVYSGTLVLTQGDSASDGLVGQVNELQSKIDAKTSKSTGLTNKGIKGNLIALEKNSIKNHRIYTLFADMTSFTTNDYMRIYHQSKEDGANTYMSGIVAIVYGTTYDRVAVYYYLNSTISAEPAPTVTTYNLDGKLSVGRVGLVVITEDDSSKSKILVYNNGTIVKEIDNVTLDMCNGKIQAMCVGDGFSNITTSFTCTKYNADTWLFGDSYMTANSTVDARWPSYLIANGYSDFLLNGYSGENSANAYVDLEVAFTHGTPKKLIWALGMNDADTASAVNSSWKTIFDKVKKLCEKEGVEFIPCTIPTASEGNSMRIHKFKNEIVRQSGYRFIDFDRAVGADETTGEWTSGMKELGGVHPIALGAKALYQEAISTVPELLRKSIDYIENAVTPVTVEASSELPTTNISIGHMAFIDGTPAWWNGENWVDATGSTI